MKRGQLSRKYLQSILHYDPSTGVFTWVVDRQYNSLAGSRAGCVNKSDGRRYIKVHCVRYAESILAWFYMTGRWPRLHVDHKNGDKACNRWDNLRQASVTNNMGNSRPRAALKGVTRVRTGKYTAQIQKSMCKMHLGTFDTAEEAHAAYAAAAKRLYGEFARTE